MKLLSLIFNWEKVVSLIKLLEHVIVKFEKATATAHQSIVQEQLIISDTYYIVYIGYLSHFPNLQKNGLKARDGAQRNHPSFCQFIKCQK